MQEAEIKGHNGCKLATANLSKDCRQQLWQLLWQRLQEGSCKGCLRHMRLQSLYQRNLS